MISFLKTLAIILLVYFALRFLMKLVTPYLLRFITKKAEKKMQEMFKGFPGAQRQTRQEPVVPKKSSKVVGEYVDFEEVVD
jgi:hypothetical protein